MADYYVDENGKITRSKKKRTDYTVDENGKISIVGQEKEELKPSDFGTTKDDIAPVKETKNNFLLDTLSYMSPAVAAYRGVKGAIDAFSEGGWFKSSKQFDDGYQMWDVTKTILGTAQDASENIVTGIVDIGEKLVDAGATIAPYLAQGAMNMNGGMIAPLEVQQAQNGAIDLFKKDASDFVKKDLYDAEKVAKILTANSTLNALGADAENDSVLDEKSDALLQSAGQLGAQIGVNALLPGSGMALMGTTAFGGEAENALKNGATLEEATLSSFITAGAEVLTERISGGIRFGGKTLDDALTKKFARTISDKFWRTGAKLGTDMVGEGLEEVLSGAISKFGQWLTYQDEKTLEELYLSEEALQEAVDSFIGGAVLGGGGGSVQAIKSAANGVDYVTELTKNEQKVVEKVYKDRVAEAEKKGKISGTEKSKIYDDVLEKMEKGYLSTDDIESALGDRSAYDALQKESEEFKTLYETESGKLSKKQQDRLAELEAKNKATPYETALKDAKSKYSDSVFNLVRGENKGKGSRLLETYNERARIGQDFQADFEKYKGTKHEESARKTIESAIQAGANNTNRVHDLVDMAAQISADTGRTFYFKSGEQIKTDFLERQQKVVAEMESIPEAKRTAEQTKKLTDLKDLIAKVESGETVVNGDITEDGITLNLDSTKPLNRTVGHEVTHSLEKAKSYKELKESLFAYAKSKGIDIESELNTRKLMYEGITDANPEAELVSDLVGDFLFTDSNYIKKLSTENRNVFQKIWDEVKYLYSVATAGSQEARELAKVKKAFEDAYRESVGNNGENTKYSLEKQNKGKYNKRSKYSETETLFLSWENGSAPVGEVKKFSRFGKTRYYEKTESGSVELSKQQFIERNKVYAENIDRRAERRFGTTADYDETTQRGSSGDYISYRDTSGDAAVFGQTIREKLPDVSRGSESSTLRNGLRNTELNQSEYNEEASANEQDASFITFSNDYATIRNFMKEGDVGEEADVNPIKYSMTKVDADYFDALEKGDDEKAQKMVDEAAKNAGYTIKAYHGTKDSFTVFKRGQDNQYDSGYLGSGFYFTGNKETAENYSDWKKGHGEKQTMNVALRMKNPLIIKDAKKPNLIAVQEALGLHLTDLDNFMARPNKQISDAITEEAKKQGYDGIVRYVDFLDETTYVVFDSNQVKSSDTLTIDDDGAVTPLSERFNTENNDIRYSLSDSDGKKLTKEQAEYFKDSKVRDENGNLKVMYHGTPNGGFTVFNEGTYFTDNKEYADRYQNPGASSISAVKTASNPKTYEVYLDIKKPFDINDAEARRIYIEDYIKGGNAMGINPYLSDAEYAKIKTIDWTEGEDLREFLIDNGYDYDGLVLDEGADGGYGDEVKSRGTSYVVFSPEQVKNVDNTNPTNDPDIRFSLSESVEETKDLMAIHNLTEEKLLKSLRLGGLPMPSVAIAKAKDGHGDFGEISVVLPKETIDPKSSRNNKLYSGDAWTPTYPSVDYKVDEKVLRNISKKLYKLVPSDVLHELGRIALDADNMTDTLNRWGGDAVEAFRNNDALKYAYLLDNDSDIKLPMKEKRISYGSRENGEIIRVAEAIPADEIKQALNGASAEMKKLEPRVRQAVTEYWQDTYGDDPVALDLLIPKEELSFSDLDGYLTDAMRYHRNGVEQTVDSRAAKKTIAYHTHQKGYERWLERTFSGIVEKEGIRNNKDYFTPSGNRRSFEALHYEHNLENVIKAMREKGEKGIGSFGGGSIFGAATTEFSSVEEMKQASDLLQKMSDEEYQAMRDEFSNRFFEIAGRLPNNKNSFMATDDAANTLVEAVAKYNTRNGIANYLRRELNGWATYSDQAVDDLIELVRDIRNMPTGYFEAKPQRAVGFDEVGVFVIPYGADVKLKQELLNRGYAIAEYDPKVEGDRTRVLNQFEEYKFSLSNVGEQVTPSANDIYGKDFRVQNPAQEIAPVAENATTVSETESVAPVAVSEKETTTEELFPDDTTPIQEEYEFLIAEREDIQGAMDAYAAVGDYESAERLMPEYEKVQSRIAEIEADDADRFASIEEADAPPEKENSNPEDVADDVPLTKALVTNLAKQIKSKLGIANNRTAEVRELIERYSKEEFPSKAHLYTEIAERFGKYTETQVDEDLKDVKSLLRTYGISVDESIKKDIADYGQFMRSNFGKVRFSNEGLPVDVAYKEFQEALPGYFPERINVPSDQLLRIVEVANMDTTITNEYEIDWQTLEEATDTIMNTVGEFKQNRKEALANKHGRESFQSLMESADQYVPPYKFKNIAPTRAEMNAQSNDDIAPVFDTDSGQQAFMPEAEAKDDIAKRLDRSKAKLREEYLRKRADLESATKNKNAYISQKAAELYQELRGLRKGVRASEQLGYLLDFGYDWSSVRAALVNIQHTPDHGVNENSAIESIARKMLNEDYDNSVYEISELEAEYERNVAQLEADAEKERTEGRKATRKELHENIVDNIKTTFREEGFDFDETLKNAKDLSTFATVDNTPQRVMEKALGYKQGQVLGDLTVNKVAQNETEGIKWLNSFTDRKNGLLAKISKQYKIKPGSKESAAAQMYAEGFYVGENNAIIAYGDKELAADFRDVKVQENIKKLARDPRIRQIYDETLAAINASRTRNAYPEIPRLDNYFLHFRAMEDTFSRLGLPFNPNDIRAKDLPTDLNGVTADLKPGQPYFASAKHRMGKRTSFDLLGGLEKYLTSAKNQIYHIDDIQTLRALRNYVAETYGQAHGLENIDTMSDEEAEQRINEVYNSHLSTFAKFLNEEANVLAGKTSLIDRGLEGVIGRRGITFLDSLNKQVGANMVGFNVSSSLTNFLAPVQAFAKSNKFDFVKAMAQTSYNKIGSIFGKGDSFAEDSPVMIRRKGADRFYRTPFEKVGDAGYVFMSAVDDISTELIARTKYNELTRKGMDSQQAHYETDKWVSRLMGDRSLGQQPQLYNSKMLGLVTKFQLEVRNQLDSQFYDTIQEAKVSTEDIENGLLRNAKKAAKITSTFVQLAVAQHLFGKAFESVAGYNPAFDIISAIIKAFGWDDEEESEDTVLDNIEQGFLELLGDLPYTSTLTGGRIPIESALPITELIKGEDQYGNEKSRWDTLKEVAPYYLMPGGYGQLKKTTQGLGMFSEDHPIAGSYTNSGNLRFPVEDTLGNRIQAGLFGQYASENARDYFDSERSPLKEKQIQEFIDVGMTIRDYWKYRDGLSKLSTLAEKADYISGLDLTTAQKNVLINNIADRKEDIDMSDYGNYGNFEEFDFAVKNPEKYSFLKENNVSYNQYKNFDEDTKDAYDWAFQNPEKFTLSKAVASDVATYRKYTKALNEIKADKDSSGKTISGSRKEKVIDYINNLDATYGEKIILYKSLYEADNTYNNDIVEYLNSRNDISSQDTVTILRELGFTVLSDGTVQW